MTTVMSGEDVARRIDEALPGSTVDFNHTDVWVKLDSILDVSKFLKENSDLDFAFLTGLTAVDYIEYFELVYHLLSMRRNASIVLKSRCYGRNDLVAPSVISVWRGADLQEREIWDLLGIHFEGHPNMKRILLWEGFDGHPLRKDYLG